MNIHWIQHVPFEGLGSIESWILAHGYSLNGTRAYRRESFPVADRFDWLIVMGGPMNIYEDDKHPWLAAERKFIKQAIDEGKVVLGICLGAQLIADALGAGVYAGSCKEIGWFPVRKTEEANASRIFRAFPSQMEVFHWHGDTFPLPSGCLHLAESDACRNQAFAYEDRVIGLQFHLEMTRQNVEAILSGCRDELVEAPYIQKAEDILFNNDKFRAANREMHGLLDRLAKVQ
ncbi:MAG: type 1 glutamine amidotransferase [Acidobacteriota bacterium]